MDQQRADARRSREQIIRAAEQLVADGLGDDALRLNLVARAAGLGVGTVYRHFPTPDALRDALGRARLEEMADRSRVAADSADPASEFFDLVRDLAGLMFAQEGMEYLLISPDPSPEIAGLRRQLLDRFEVVLAAAIAGGAVRPEVTAQQIQGLLCGIEHAVRIQGGKGREQLTAILLDGLRAR